MCDEREFVKHVFFFVWANHDDLPDLSTTFAQTEFWHINSTCAVRCWPSEAVATCQQLRDVCRRRPALSPSFEPPVIRFCKPDGVVANWKSPQLISWKTMIERRGFDFATREICGSTCFAATIPPGSDTANDAKQRPSDHRGGFGNGVRI